ncbi:MAG: lipocalin family protein [Wenzhouxiangellaceae bacterium]
MIRQMIRLPFYRTLAAALCGLLAPVVMAQDETPATVAQVDLKRYTGTWYEIAKIPNRFQDQCVGNTTASYQLRDDGRIDVINRCLDEDGEYDQAKGVARVVDSETNARLEVSFVSLLGWHLFWGDYWIIGLAEDYRYAVIGHPQREYGWILSRQPQLTPSDRAHIDALLRNAGYDPQHFEATPQDIAADAAG